MSRSLGLAALALLLHPASAILALTGVGLSPVRSQHLENPTLGDNGPQEGDIFGRSLAIGDFDGDGLDDLAVGEPGDSGPIASPVPSSGSVVVYFGTAGGGPILSSPRRLTQLGAECEAGDVHGFALAACDFNGDGFDDLAVGAPGETVGSAQRAGAVFVYFGGAGGPVAAQFVALRQGASGMPQTNEANDRLGEALACGDFDQDGHADLAIGAPGETLGTSSKAGWAVAIPGSATGLVPAASLELHQLGAALPSEPENDDAFGAALAVGDLDGDGFADLAIGVPGEDLAAGAAHVLFGGAGGLATAGAMLLTDEALGGLSEFGDRFAAALAFGDFDADGFDDLVIGIESETFASAGGPIVETGQVVAVYGSTSIPTPGLVAYWAENNIHGAGESEAGDHFGAALATGDFDGDGFDDLAVGHPGESTAADPLADRGATTVLVGTADGLSQQRRRLFVSAQEGVPGPTFSAGRFGSALAGGDLDGDGFDDLAIGAQLENGVAEAQGAVTALRGALFADGFETGDAGYWPTASSSQ